MSLPVRYQVVGVTTLAAVIMYLDRVCIAEIAKLDGFTSALSLSDSQKGLILAAFFYTYALGQVPAGWLSDRLGARSMMPLYVGIWSLCTILTGVANGFVMLLAARLMFGVAQSGCFPTASSLNKRWIPARHRGTTSSVIAFGGRLGGAIAPVLTAWLLRDYLGWRTILLIYGGVGFGVAACFWWIYRDRPDQHPNVTSAELEIIRDGKPPARAASVEFPPVLELIANLRMWMMCIVQIGINIGWAFLITWMPTYLKEVRDVSPGMSGLISTLVLTAGIVGMLSGGPLTDFLTRRIGQRWGRLAPLIGCYSLAALAWVSCLMLDSTTGFVIAAALVAFATDMSVPSIWAYMQDVGGTNTASVFGWGNMWGNLGAAAAAQLVPQVRHAWDSNGDWHEVFMLQAAGFVIAGIAALGLDATKPVQREFDASQ